MKKLTVDIKEKNKCYPIIIKDGLLEELDRYLSAGQCLTTGQHPNGQRKFLITNKKIYSLYEQYLKCFDSVIFMKDGEEYKNFDTYKMIIDTLLDLKIERNDCIVAFGGGVVGDIAGFVASTVLRGIDFVQIPTTLLAQVDSSVGGKTGINHEDGKNLIGTFYQPKMVLIDPNTLSTLDNRQIKTGLGEVVKYAFIEKTCNANLEGSFFDYLMQNSPVWNEIIYTSCLLKSAVVAQDEQEEGLRAILNLGHTFAHAIEKVSNYKVYTHGETVGMGVKMALKLSLNMGLIEKDYYDKGVLLLNLYGLDIKLDERYSAEDIYEAMKSDKKVSGKKINLILPTGFGQVELFADIEEPLIKASLL